MSEELAERPKQQPVALSDMGQTPNPLKLLPREWRKPVSFFWMFNAHILKDSTAICARFRMWIEYGLTLDDAKKIMRSLTSPEVAAVQRGSWDVLADLAQKVAETLKRNKEEAAMKARREADTTNAKETFGVVSSLAQAFKEKM